MYHAGLARPYTSQQQSLFQQGYVVQVEARSRFPGGVLIDAPYWDFSLAHQQTKQALKLHSPYIYEAFFQVKKFIARVDILELKEREFNIIEVKSALSVKQDHILDLAIQRYILNECKAPVRHCYLLHLNRECTYPDLNQLFVQEDVTDQVEEMQDQVRETMLHFKEILNSKKIPNVDIGNHCFKPYPCRFMDQCWTNIPSPNVFSIPSLGELSWKYYNKKQIHLKDVLEDDLTPRQKVFKRVHLTGQPYINKEAIQKELSKWEEPLYFLDFETLGSAIPRFDQTKPFQHIPFQYSALLARGLSDANKSNSKNKCALKINIFQNNCLSSLNEYQDYLKQNQLYEDSFNDQKLVIEEDHYLHPNSNDPRRDLAERLVRFIGFEGSVVAYYKEFESLRLKELANLFPDLSERLISMSSRLVDPLPLLRENVCFKEFGSSWSIKSVAPVLLGSNWRYSLLGVSDGLMAQNGFEEMISMEDGSSKKEILKNNLILYCRQDTWCLLGIVRWLYGQI